MGNNKKVKAKAKSGPGNKEKGEKQSVNIKKALRVNGKKNMDGKEAPELELEDINKGHQSGFLAFLKCSQASKDAPVREQAEAVLVEYKKLSRDGKRDMVLNFFRSGGKRQGLRCVYTQKVIHKSTANTGSWEGWWLTPGAILKILGVQGR